MVDDGAYRRLGTSGEVMIQPGDLEWFRAASQVRGAAATGLVARLVPGVTEGGFDPAAGYRTFEATHRARCPNPATDAQGCAATQSWPALQNARKSQ